MADAELRALLELRCIPGLGDRRLSRLLQRHGSAEAVRSLPIGQLSPGADERQLRPIRARAERAWRLIERQELELFALHLPGYPVVLQELPDPPVLLFARGETKLLGGLSVAVVGTRRPTEYGVSVTEQLVAGLARAGVVVWSGLARGIDSVAHRVALDGGGATVAVLGSGIDVPYPREHAGLLEEIARFGLVLSEFMPGEPPLPHHFPQRNRIIACLAHGVLVVEARPDGGALITADAASASRPIMAVPGPIGRLTSMGPNRLIQEGAKLVVEVADILEEIGGPLNAAAACGRPSARRHWKKSGRAAGARANPAQLALVGEPITGEQPAGLQPPGPGAGRGGLLELFTGREALHTDEVAELAGLSAGAALSGLLELELAGSIEQVGGKRFRRVPRPDPDRHRLRRPDESDDGNRGPAPVYTSR